MLVQWCYRCGAGESNATSKRNYDYALATAQAGEMLGNKLIYLEAGSGAENPVPLK
jgi:heptaprenylglyceryl phosphate synthase